MNPPCAPQTLSEWRHRQINDESRNAWTELEPFFLSQGYTLWEISRPKTLRPPNEVPRTLDDFADTTIYNSITPRTPKFFMEVKIT